jgi:hypothetical protein
MILVAENEITPAKALAPDEIQTVSAVVSTNTKKSHQIHTFRLALHQCM